MKFFSDIRLLMLGLWLGAAVFFIGAAQVAFSVLQQQRDTAGAVVGAELTLLNYSGIVLATILILSTLVGVANFNKIWLWIERFLLLLLGAACAIGQFMIGFWISSVKAQMGKPIDELAVDDPLRLQFNALHQYSEWILLTAMIAALMAFFIISNRKFGTAKPVVSDVYDFSKEFKI